MSKDSEKHIMKTCPQCGAVIDPYRVKCEYCGAMYFDLASWIEDGRPCYINYKFDAGYGAGTITALAIPKLQTIEINSEINSVTDTRGNIIRQLHTDRACDMCVNFRLIEDNTNTLFHLTGEYENDNLDLCV